MDAREVAEKYLQDLFDKYFPPVGTDVVIRKFSDEDVEKLVKLLKDHSSQWLLQRA